MKKILILSDTPIVRGAELVLLDYLNKTKNREFICISMNRNPMLDDFLKQTNVRHVYRNRYQLKCTGLFKIFKPILLFLAVIKITRIIRAEKINTVIANTSMDSIYGLVLKLIYPKLKFIAMFHDMITLRRLNKLFFYLLNFCADSYVVVSGAVKNRLLQLGASLEKIKLIYNGLEIQEIEPKKKYLNLRLIFVGSIEDRKNPLEFLSFIKEIDRNNINYQATIVYNDADNDLFNEFKIQAKGYNVEYFYNASRKVIFNKMREATFLVLTSIADPLPTVILESQNVGTPCIAKNIDGVPEMITDGVNGFLYDEKFQLLNLVESLKTLTNNSYEELSKNSINNIKNNFSIDNKVKSLDVLFFN
ncbi:glycosyltransferase [Labilibaculum sp.]|uniref:glycosyltransferase n=1 Tax=Labilibaculum sp. TaxID=2060723 RepID=UPI003562AAAD